MGTTISNLLAQTHPSKSHQANSNEHLTLSETNSEHLELNLQFWGKLGTKTKTRFFHAIRGFLLLVPKDFWQLFEALRGAEQPMHHAVRVATDGRREMRVLIHGLNGDVWTQEEFSHVKTQRFWCFFVSNATKKGLYILFAWSFCHYCKLFWVRAEKQGQNASNLSPLRIQWRSTKLLPCIEWSWAEQAWHRFRLPPQLHQFEFSNSKISKPVEKWIIRFLHGIQRLLQRFVGFVAEILDTTGLASKNVVLVQFGSVYRMDLNGLPEKIYFIYLDIISYMHYAYLVYYRCVRLYFMQIYLCSVLFVSVSQMSTSSASNNSTRVLILDSCNTSGTSEV